MYLNISASGIEVVADDVPSETNNYTDPKRVLQFPMSLGQSFTDAYVDMDGPSSVTWSYTGHGTAITPMGTYPDLAKVVSTEDDILLWNTTPLYPLVIDNGSTVLVFAPSGVGIRTSAHGPLCRCTPILARTTWWWKVRSTQRGALPTCKAAPCAPKTFNGMELQHLQTSDLATGSYILLMSTEGKDRTIRFNKQ